MDDVQVMRYLARSLTHAASQHDWPAMQDVDAQIAALLASLKGQTLSAEKREALADLQQTHANVSRFCQAQSDDLEQKMASARRNREGATAYALFADAEDRGPMNLMLSQLTQLTVAADPTDVAPVQAADAGAAAVPESQDAASQAAPAFNDALLNIVNSLLGGEQPRDYAMVLADVKAKDDSDDDQDTQTPDAQTLAQNLIGSPQQLLDALLMASRMPTKTLNATPESVPLPGDRLKMQSFAVGNPPIATPLKAVPQPMILSLTPEPATDAATKPAMTEFTKTLATVLPVAGQPTAVQTPSTVTDKQPVNLPPIKMDADEAKWAQQLHSALNDRLQIQVRNQVQHATIRLDPPEMGKVDISLQIENGRMQVHISASNGETYRSLQQISNELRQSLTEQNFVQVNVQVSSQSGQHQQRQQQSGSAQEAGPMAGAVIDADDGFTTADHDDSVLLTV